MKSAFLLKLLQVELLRLVIFLISIEACCGSGGELLSSRSDPIRLSVCFHNQPLQPLTDLNRTTEPKSTELRLRTPACALITEVVSRVTK